MAQEPSAHRLRLGRYSQAQQIYLITTVTLGRQPVFADFARARQLVALLKQTQARQQASTLAFVVMPDHLHWLMQLGEGQKLSVCVQRLKSLSAHAYQEPLWQPGFHDHAVRSEEDLPALARYIVSNPVRAGLVPRTGLYPHWDAVWV